MQQEWSTPVYATWAEGQVQSVPSPFNSAPSSAMVSPANEVPPYNYAHVYAQGNGWAPAEAQPMAQDYFGSIPLRPNHNPLYSPYSEESVFDYNVVKRSTSVEDGLIPGYQPVDRPPLKTKQSTSEPTSPAYTAKGANKSSKLKAKPSSTTKSTKKTDNKTNASAGRTTTTTTQPPKGSSSKRKAPHSPARVPDSYNNTVNGQIIPNGPQIQQAIPGSMNPMMQQQPLGYPLSAIATAPDPRAASEQIGKEAWRVCKAQALEMAQRRVQLLEHESGALERETELLQHNMRLMRETIASEQANLEEALRRAERLKRGGGGGGVGPGGE